MAIYNNETDPNIKLNASDLMRQYDMKKYSNLKFKTN